MNVHVSCEATRALVRISVIEHESCPLGHLSQVSEGVVEILDSSQVSVWGEVEGELKTRLVTKDAGQDGNVASLIKDPLPLAIAGCHVAEYLSCVCIPQLLSGNDNNYCLHHINFIVT